MSDIQTEAVILRLRVQLRDMAQLENAKGAENNALREQYHAMKQLCDAKDDALKTLTDKADAYKWAYEYLQSRMVSIGRVGWASDCDDEILFRCRMNIKL